MGSNTNKSPLQIQAEDMSANIVSVFPSTAKIPFEGQMLTPTAIAGQLTDGLADITAAASAKLVYTGAVAKKKASVANLKALVSAVVAYARLMMAGDTAGQASLGIQPKKKSPKMSTADKAASAALGQATKKGRTTKPVKAKTVVLGADGQPLDGSTLPTATPVANGAAASSSTAPAAAPVGK